jgi:diaminopimelate epimerase
VVVGLGNPHCVVFVEDVEGVPWRAWGEVLEVHPAFPRRTNVQVVAVTGPASIDVRIWERGAGPTMASGSSACAAASAAVRMGRLAAGPIAVAMPGGEVQVEVSPDFTLRLDGPVERVGRLELDEGWWERRARLHTCR